jgi:transcription initiation factor TFIIB
MGINDNAKHRSAIIYRKAVEGKLSRGRPMDALICACLFSGCKDNETPKPLEVFFRYADERQIKNCIGLLVDEMSMNIIASEPKDFVEEISEKGCISNVARIKAYRILEKLKDLGLPPSRDPRGLAAAALYIGCKASDNPSDRTQTQRDLAVYAGLTEVTVRNRIRDIKTVLIIKMPETVEDTEAIVA